MIVATAAGVAPTTILLPGGGVAHVEVPAIADFRDDVGAGDVFAAAFFVALAKGQAPRRRRRFRQRRGGRADRRGAGAGAIGDRAAIEARLRAVA